MRTGLKIILLLASLAIGFAQVRDRVASFAGDSFDATGLVLFGGVFGLCIAGLLIAAFVRRGWLRWAYAAVFAIGSLLVGGYQLVVGDHMAYESFVDMAQAGGSFHEAWAQHAGTMLLGAAEAALLLLGIGLSPKGAFRKWARWLAPVPLLAIVLVMAMLFQRGGEGGRGLPPAYLGMAYGSFLAGETLLSPVSEREEVTLRPGTPPVQGDIVLVVDESISANYLDINHPDGVRSGLLDAAGGAQVYNFGVAAAVSHCSASANQTLRFGGTREDYRRINATMPSIWSYAQAAGYETVYIDAQREGGTYNNLMDAAELERVDRWIQYDDVPVRDRDHRAARDIAGMTRDGQPQFILLNKVGAHFPIQDKFPDSHAEYRPMAPRGKFGDIADTGSREGFSGTADSWRLYRNSYRNTLLWNVGGFFDELLGGADLSQVTIIYTADHGQDLHETGRLGSNTHCSPDPNPVEGAVPLAVITGSGASSLGWSDAGDAAVSHYRIFPTLLRMMGYDVGDVRGIYGADMLSTDSDPLTFNARFNARLGQGPRWIAIEPDALPSPPASDATTTQ